MSSDDKIKPDDTGNGVEDKDSQLPNNLAQPLAASSIVKVICNAKPPMSTVEGGIVKLSATTTSGEPNSFIYEWRLGGKTAPSLKQDPNKPWIAFWDTTGFQPGNYEISVDLLRNPQSGIAAANQASIVNPPIKPGLLDRCEMFITVTARPLQKGDSLNVSLQRTRAEATLDLPLWIVIQRTTQAISFTNYQTAMDLVLCNIGNGTGNSPVKTEFNKLRQRRFLPYNDTDAYRLLKAATEAFLMVNCGVTLDGLEFTQDEVDDLQRRTGISRNISELDTLWDGYLEEVNGSADLTLPYLALIQRKLKNEPLKTAMFNVESDTPDLSEQCFGILREKLTRPCLIELLWSYWQEEAMLVQTLNAITLRFQNVRHGQRDPLSMMEIDPLRPLNNLLWGYIQDEQHRLTVPRRVYEYSHHYGLTLYGKAVPALRPADNRSKFLEAFHHLLYVTSFFFRQDDDTTKVADPFPVLNALREVHFLLAEGAHNQFGDLPSTARQEMLIQQWLLARPEFREFLPTRTMVALPEPWMDRVDAMKTLQGWTDVSVVHFSRLAIFGERLLLSIRFGDWGSVEFPAQAATWARFWRSEIQGYTHAYRAVTGVDLTSEITDSRREAERYVLPSVHLRNRLEMQRRVR